MAFGLQCLEIRHEGLTLEIQKLKARIWSEGATAYDAVGLCSKKCRSLLARTKNKYVMAAFETSFPQLGFVFVQGPKPTQKHEPQTLNPKFEALNHLR